MEIFLIIKIKQKNYEKLEFVITKNCFMIYNHFFAFINNNLFVLFVSRLLLIINTSLVYLFKYRTIDEIFYANSWIRFKFDRLEDDKQGN